MSKWCSLAILFVLTPALAAENRWSPNGPSGPFVYDVAYVNDANGVALAVTSNGVYRTANHGLTWTRSRELGTSYPKSITIDPSNRNRVAVFSDGVWRSSDGGVTFESGPALETTGVHSLAFGADGTLWAGFYSGILRRSSDIGATWAFVAGPSAAVPNPVQVSTDATSADVVYAFTQNGAFRSDNRGGTWSPLAGASALSQFHVSRGSSGVVFAHRTSDYIPFRSDDFGNNWHQTGNTGLSWISTGGTAGRVVGVTNELNFVSSTDNGSTWTDRGRLPNAITVAHSFGMTDPARMLSATPAGVIATSNGGASWEERNSGIPEAVATTLLPPVGQSTALHVVTADLQSIYRRDSATGEWQGIARASTPTMGFPASASGRYAVAIAPSNPNLFYMSRDGGFGRSLDGGATWTRLSAMPNANKIAVHPVNPQVLYLGTTTFMPGAPSAFKSTDGGATWQPLSSSLPPGIVDIAIDPQQPDTVYMLSLGFGSSGFTPVYRSTDAGATWNSTGWPGSVSFQGHRLLLGSATPGTLYLGLDDSLHRSTDSGANWTALSTYPYSNAGTRDLFIDPANPDIVYATSARFNSHARSVDRGDSWEPICAGDSNALPVSLVSIALAPGRPGRLIGTRTSALGVYECDVTAWLGITADSADMTAGTAKRIVFTVTNAGQISATRFRLSGTLPAATGAYEIEGFGTGGADCTLTGSALSCDVPILRPNATRTVSVRFNPVAAGTWTLTMSAYEPLTGGLSQTVTVAAPPPPSGSSSGGGSSGGGGGGGGGGRVDYLVLGTMLACMLQRRRFLGAAQVRH